MAYSRCSIGAQGWEEGNEHILQVPIPSDAGGMDLLRHCDHDGVVMTWSRSFDSVPEKQVSLLQKVMDDKE